MFSEIQIGAKKKNGITEIVDNGNEQKQRTFSKKKRHRTDKLQETFLRLGVDFDFFSQFHVSFHWPVKSRFIVAYSFLLVQFHCDFILSSQFHYPL